MQRAVVIRLTPAFDHVMAFRQAMAVSFDAVTQLGWTDRCCNGVELHKRSYYALRERFPTMPSQRCSLCGHVHKRSRFVCVACGFEINADLNAARNIGWKHLQACVPSGETGGPPTPRAKAHGVNRPKATVAKAIAADVAMKGRAQHGLDSVTSSGPLGPSS